MCDILAGWIYVKLFTGARLTEPLVKQHEHCLGGLREALFYLKKEEDLFPEVEVYLLLREILPASAADKFPKKMSVF